MFYVRKIGKEYNVSEVQSSDDSGEFESYIDAYIFAKEMSGNISLEKYKEIKKLSDNYKSGYIVVSELCSSINKRKSSNVSNFLINLAIFAIDIICLIKNYQKSLCICLIHAMT